VPRALYTLRDRNWKEKSDLITFLRTF